MAEENLIYQIALTLIPGVGDVLGKKLVSVFGSAERVFREPWKALPKMGRVGNLIALAVKNKEILLRAEREAMFVARYGITPLYFQDKQYPQRLKHCYDSPVLLFYKGTADLNVPRIVGVVGTRSATAYGKTVTQQLIGDLVSQQILIVSGLAYGIDGCAHRVSLDLGLNTVGVLGHGLDRIYPCLHKSLAERMLTQGGLVSEFLSGSKPDRENFPRRNRIIAGLCDAIIVVEAATKGGALITADIANSYNRDVFAVPGRMNDLYSEGTNYLIRTNRAALIQKAGDLEYLMGWKQDRAVPKVIQRKIFQELTPEEDQIVNLMQDQGQVSIDEITIRTGLAMSIVSSALLNLEFEGVVKCLPGKVYLLL
ncbi:MAG: DNA-processing protein DprA [Bacteroidota bacterium]